MTAALDAGSQALTQPARTWCCPARHNLLHVQDLSSNMGNLRRLFDAFEQKTSLLQLLDQSAQGAPGVQIFIGGESGLLPLDECSVVTAPYEVDGQVVGTVGVIGPTRMAYERVIPIVDITAKLLVERACRTTDAAISKSPTTAHGQPGPHRHPADQSRHPGGAHRRRRCGLT